MSTSDLEDGAKADRRVARARAGVRDARSTARSARLAAADALWRRALARSHRFRVAMLVAVVTIVALLVAAGVLWFRTDAAGDAERMRTEALDAARAGVRAMLTADPDESGAYADRVIDLSVGAQRERLVQGREVLVAEVSTLSQPTTGYVLAAGLIADPDAATSESAGSETTASALVVAESSDPELLGGTEQSSRLVVQVELVRTDEGWRMSEATPS